MKLMKKWKRLLISLGSFVLVSTLVTSISTACSSNAKDSNKSNVLNIEETNEINKIQAGFDIDDLVIEPPIGDNDLKIFSSAYDNYNQEVLKEKTYFQNFTSTNQQTKQQLDNPYKYLFLEENENDIYKKSINIGDNEFYRDVIKLTPNTLLNDFYAFFEKTRIENQNATFSYIKPKINVYKLINDQKIPFSDNQSIFSPLTTYDIQNGISFEQKNQNIFISIDFWIAFTNQRTNAVLIKDPFTNRPRSISSNSSEKFIIKIDNTPFKLNFVNLNKIIKDPDSSNIDVEKAIKMQYFFDKIIVDSQETTIKKQAKISKNNKENIIVKEPQQHFIGDNNFIFGSGSYTLNKEIENATSRDDIFNLEKIALQSLRKINKEQILKDIKDAFEEGYSLGLDGFKNIFYLLKSIYEDKSFKQILLENKNGINSFVKKITQNNQLANLIYKFVSNQSLGALIESFKPLVPKILKSFGVDKVIQKTILDRINFMDFENNLIEEINKIIPLIDSISLAEVKKYRPLIIKVLDLVKVEQARSIRETPGIYGVIDFLDRLLSLLLNLNPNEIPNEKIIDLGDKKVGIADLVAEIKSIFDLIIPKQKDNQQQETIIYKLSDVSILDFISLNKNNELDYREGFKKMVELIKKFNLPIPSIVFNLIDDILINNKNWNKENVFKVLEMFLFPTFKNKTDERIVDLFTFVKYGIQEPKLLDENMIFNEENQEIENLRLVYKYQILTDVEFDISPVIDLLPEKSPEFIGLGDSWEQIKKEIPRKIYLVKDDFVTLKLSINKNQKLTPLIFNDLSIDKYRLGYSIYPDYEVDANLVKSISKIIVNNKRPNETILPQKYLSQILGYIMYKRWKFSNVLSIYKTVDDSGLDVIKNDLDTFTREYEPNSYRPDFNFIYNENKLDTIINDKTVRESLVENIRTVKLSDQVVETDVLGRETRVLKTNDVHNITLDRLIAEKVIEFGREVNIKNDVHISVTPLVFGFNTKTDSSKYKDNQEIKYDLLLAKKAIIKLNFSKPILNKRNNKLVYSFTFLI